MRLPTVTQGQNVYVNCDLTATDLPAGALYILSFNVNGQVLTTGTLTFGAGVAGTSSEQFDWGQFEVGPGTNQISVTADPAQSVVESSDADNTATATVTAATSATNSLTYSVSQIRSAYGLNSLADFGSAFADGSGQTIAVVDAFDDPYILSDLDAFDNGMDISPSNGVTLSQLYGSAASFVTVYNQSGTDITSQIASSGVSARCRDSIPDSRPTPAVRGKARRRSTSSGPMPWRRARY